MYDELVKNLRNRRICVQSGGDLEKDFPLMRAAADAIEELSKRMSESIPKSDAEIIIEELSKPRWILAPQEEYDGLKRKYVVLKSDTGEIVENCFVLRPDKDKAAIAALLAYADATDNQVLAKDIRAWISAIPAEEGE